MSTFSEYEVRVCRSGVLMFRSSTPTALADCQAQATTFAAANPLEAFCVVHRGQETVGSAQIVLPGPQAVVTAST